MRREDVSTVERVGNLLIGLASKASHYGLSILFESHRCQNTTSKMADNIGRMITALMLFVWRKMTISITRPGCCRYLLGTCLRQGQLHRTVERIIRHEKISVLKRALDSFATLPA